MGNDTIFEKVLSSSNLQLKFKFTEYFALNGANKEKIYEFLVVTLYWMLKWKKKKYPIHEIQLYMWSKPYYQIAIVYSM